jgi:GDP-L-fucose synthase
MNKDAKIYVAGHRGMVGSAVVRALEENGFQSIITRTHADLDLTDQSEVRAFFQSNNIQYAVIAAAKVGGIHANNSYPAEFIYENLAIAQNTIHEAYASGVERLLFLGSTCIYPKFAKQPIQEASLLTDALESTNEAYAIAKIAGLKLCQFYRQQYGVLYHSAMPTNLYGRGDNYHSENSHVMPALIRRIHEAKEVGAPEVVVWGTGKPLREFLHSEDAASGILHLLNIENPPDWVNLGSGREISIGDLAQMISGIIGYNGVLKFDTSKPDGTPRKVTDIQLISDTGWRPQISLEEGVASAYQEFLFELKQGTVRF